MNDPKFFIQNFAKKCKTSKHFERAIALLWFYSQNKTHADRTAGELAKDLKDFGLAKPHQTELKKQLKKSKFALKGARKDSFHFHIIHEEEIENKCKEFLEAPILKESHSIIPLGLVPPGRKYLESFVLQINSCYDYSFYDASAVLMRRLMESLIIEVYIFNKRHTEIRKNNQFFMLTDLIKFIISDNKILLSKNAPKTMKKIKDLGDNASHSRTYLTKKPDIDENKTIYRTLITELLFLSGIKT